ncbi:MAG: transposase [Candidatus Omnitrophota bacterium]|nr:transposase [Candidatus Omnitrophota bacterium]
MARPYRLQTEDCFYHITSRGDNKKKIYVSEYDYKKFLEYILNAKARFKFYIYAYVLMPNHYHFLIKTLHANLSKLMHYINGSYTTYYNVKRKKSGHLFQGRYKSIVVDTDSYFSILSRYIHLNPVLAKLVKFPEEYKWSSCNAYIKKEKDEIIDKGEINRVLGMSARQYRQFMMEGLGKKENPFKDLYGGFILGGTKFIQDKLNELREQVEGGEFSHQKDLKRYISIKSIDDLMEREYGKRIKEMRAKRTWTMRKKRIAIYLMRKFAGLDNKEIGGVFRMNSSAVSKAAMSIEKGMNESSQLRKEMKKLFSIFEG